MFLSSTPPVKKIVGNFLIDGILLIFFVLIDGRHCTTRNRTPAVHICGENITEEEKEHIGKVNCKKHIFIRFILGGCSWAPEKFPEMIIENDSGTGYAFDWFGPVEKQLTNYATGRLFVVDFDFVAVVAAAVVVAGTAGGTAGNGVLKILYTEIFSFWPEF